MDENEQRLRELIDHNRYPGTSPITDETWKDIVKKIGDYKRLTEIADTIESRRNEK